MSDKEQAVPSGSGGKPGGGEKRKRGRPRKPKPDQPEEPKPKRPRGRPPGSKKTTTKKHFIPVYFRRSTHLRNPEEDQRNSLKQDPNRRSQITDDHMNSRQQPILLLVRKIKTQWLECRVEVV
ncbi:hypothetical protein FSP39_000485 [Pinctada imbricata]|uniref:Uncharacterized protein n=1 Tax=Pinctada imbricata TaxID=66713 RepID=A0AA89BY60_PINIB|nr:hypothetical protein FSP39_000485 [Pinctada imbricata]